MDKYLLNTEKKEIDNITEMLSTKIDPVTTIGYITNINKESVSIRLFDNGIFIKENLNISTEVYDFERKLIGKSCID